MSAGIPGRAAAIGTSLWKAVNPPPTAAVALRERLSTDVLIIGAGVAGLSLGLHLGERKADLVVLEADEDANSATGSSAGIIAPQLVRTTPHAVLKRLGREVGARVLRLIAESGHYTFGLIDRWGIECGATRAGFLNPVRGKPAAAAHAQLVEEWLPYRDDLRLIDGDEVQSLSGCHGYSAGIIDSSGGGLDPLAYCRGLARAVRAGGAPVHYGSRVLSLERVQDRWIAHTASGEVAAQRVVLCANGGNAALHPALAQTVLPLPVCEVATRPLDAHMREKILPYGHTLTDTSTDVFSIRYDRDGRLITACPGRSKIDYAQINDFINRRLAAMIPEYRTTPLEYVWQGTAWLNSSLLPRVLRVDDGLLAVQACNGRGIGLNTLIGRELGRWLVSPMDEAPLVPMESPKPVPGFMFARYLPGLMMVGAAIAKRTLERFGRRT